MMYKQKSSHRLLQIIFISLGVQISLWGHAQELVGSDDFFKRTMSESQSLDHDYNKQRVSLPWIETYELRTETDEFDFNRQRYTARLTPTAPGVRKAQASLFHHYRKKLSLVETAYLHDRIEKAYYLWTSLYLNAQKLTVYTRLKDINQDKLTVYKKQAQMEDFDYAKILDTQQEISELNLNIHELLLTIKAEKTKADLNEEVLTFDDMISIDQMEELLLNHRSPEHIDDEYFYEKELLNKEIALEKALKRKIFDFAQIEYGGPHNELLNERISVGLALKIPTSGSKNLKIEEMRIEQQELDLEHQILRQEIAKELMHHFLNVQSKIEIYKKLEQLRVAEHQTYLELSDLIAKDKGADPIFLLNIYENMEKVKLDNLKRMEEIYNEYIAYLAVSKKMFAQPFKNYLLGTSGSPDFSMEE